MHLMYLLTGRLRLSLHLEVRTGLWVTVSQPSPLLHHQRRLKLERRKRSESLCFHFYPNRRPRPLWVGVRLVHRLGVVCLVATQAPLPRASRDGTRLRRFNTTILRQYRVRITLSVPAPLGPVFSTMYSDRSLQMTGEEA